MSAITGVRHAGVGGPPDRPEEMYLELLKHCLTRIPFDPRPVEFHPTRKAGRLLFRLLGPSFRRRELRVVRDLRHDPEAIRIGMVGHADAETMVGLERLDNVHRLIVDVLRRGVPGDLVETGVWRGGVTILMRAVLKVHGVTDRLVWAADSFQGLPVPDPERYPADAQVSPLVPFADGTWANNLAVSLEDVRANFERYGLLDDRVRFLPGWFKDTLPSAPIERIAVLRLDGDLYESTIQALEALYPRVSEGGYVIVDDYGSWESCKAAVDDYRGRHSITEELQMIDWTGAFWRRGAPVGAGT